MRKTLLILAVAMSAMSIPILLPAPAEAGVSWSIGSVFSVGGLDFSLVFGRPYGLYGDGYYYRTHRPIHYHGYNCHGGCSYRAGYYYHHPNCSVVRHHFRRHSFHPDSYWAGVPWYYGGSVRYDRYRHDYRRYKRHHYDKYPYDRHRYERYRYDSGRHDRYRYRDGDRDSDSDRYDRRHRSERGHDSGRYDKDRSRRDDGHRGDRYGSSRRGSDTRSRGRHRGD
jgi:hypothetical protein